MFGFSIRFLIVSVLFVGIVFLVVICFLVSVFFVVSVFLLEVSRGTPPSPQYLPKFISYPKHRVEVDISKCSAEESFSSARAAKSSKPPCVF